MFQNYQFTVADRFKRYVQVDTQSDPHSTTYPSTDKQKELGRLLAGELQQMGLEEVRLDEFGYVYASIPSNSPKAIPSICFCAHMDTSPDCSGKNVIPLVHENYSGTDILLPEDPSQVISTRDYPYLLEKIGEDIITASGTTLLGADDKAGIAIVMDMTNFILTTPELKHGPIRILFTPDEEIGRGVDKLDLLSLQADFAYTLDGGELGNLETETFSADAVTISFFGISAHPGYAKDKMVNSIKIASYFLDLLPSEELSPESTDGRYGFVHPVQVDGTVEKTTLQFIIRDYITSKLAAYEEYLKGKMEESLEAFPGGRAEFKVKEQYRNMQEILDLHPQVVAHAEEAIRRAGVEVKRTSARGGTDGSRLSFMGLPCPNIFTGEMAFHGKHEFISIQDMKKSVETIVHLAAVWEEAAF